MLKKKKQEITVVPNHIAIIMDGNGRWAKARFLPRMAGHHAGTESLRKIIRACIDFEVRYLTIYAFSTENWKRPHDEVEGLMNIFGDYLDKEVPELNKQGVQIHHLGSEQELSPELQNKMQSAIDLTKGNNKLIFSIALNYGGQDEIVHAIREIVKEGIPADAINKETIKQHLYTSAIPDPDLVIRTSGEMRTSNFLVWQSAYSEWLFTKTLWPDFNKEALREAILEYGTRSRRFGGRTEDDQKESYHG